MAHDHSTLTLLPGDESVKAYPFQDLVRLDQTSIDFGKEAMRPLDADNVESLIQADITSIPPIEIVLTNVGPVVVDGYHRLEAVRQRIEREVNERYSTETERENALSHGLSHATIDGIARSYPHHRDVIKAAFKANITHGLTLSSSSRTKFALWLLDTARASGEKLGIRAAARQAGISHPTLIEAIARREKKNKGVELPEGATDDIKREEAVSLFAPAESVDTPPKDQANETDKIMTRFAKVCRETHTLLSALPDEDAALLVIDYLNHVPDLAVLEYLSKLVPQATKTRKEREEKDRKRAAKSLERANKKTKTSQATTSQESPINQGFENVDRSEYVNNYTS